MKKLVFLTAILYLSACSNGPKPIAYGQAACHFCKMTIVDKQHAAQLVTSKGKVFNFDASECMINYLKVFDSTAVGHLMVNDYSLPGSLIHVTDATFLVSERIPSPMGEYITAFGSLENAQKARGEHEGELFTWEKLKQQFD